MAKNKPDAWFVVYQCFETGDKEEITALKGNRYLALQEAFKQHRHDKDSVFIVRQKKFHVKETRFDTTIATFGPHFPLVFVQNYGE